jgi:plastocyanin
MTKNAFTIKLLTAVLCLAVLLGGAMWMMNQSGRFQNAQPGSANVRSVTVSVVTNEIKWTSPDGKQEIEAYRWDPGYIVVKQGDSVVLEFYGVKGENHPFVIDGYNLKGTVERGKTQSVNFLADKPGTFQIRCLTHPDTSHHGPMVATLVVLPN